MASRFALVVLACAVVACKAEAPFRGYSSRQQAAPYPAAGYRPDRTFSLPSEQAIAQQLRLAQLYKRQQQQQQQQQQRPSQLYGAPESEPQEPSGLYGAPAQRPSQVYGAPQEAAPSQLRPQVLRPQPSRQYVAPQEAAPSQRQPSRQYGAPSPRPAPEGTSAESLEETKEVETVAAVSNAIDNKPGRLTQGERDTENDEAETKAAVAAQPAGLVLVPLAAGFTAQKLAYIQAPAVAPAFAKLQLPAVAPAFAKLQLPAVAPQLVAAQGYFQPQQLAAQGFYQPQQFAFAAPLQAW